MKNKKLVFFVVGGLLLILLVIGGTYAYFNWTSTSEDKDASLSVSSVSADGVCEKITDNNMILKPVAARENGRVVTINTKQKISKYAFVSWNLTINSINTNGYSGTGLKHRTVRYELVNTTTGAVYANGNLNGVNAGDTIVLDNILETLAYNTDYTFTFYLWIDGNFGITPSDTLNQTYDFDLTCNMTGTPSQTGNYLMAQPTIYNSQYGLYLRASNNILGKQLDPSKFESITTVNSATVPNGVNINNVWDVSNAQNNSVKAWYTDTDNDGLYELFIGQDGGVIANPSCLRLFSGFSNVTSIDLTYFDTSYVTDMSHIFSGCSSLAALNVSGFDTSNVISMDGLFTNCSLLSSIDLSNFNTSKVTGMRGMFYSCSALTNLNVSSFDTSKVTDMEMMFYDCSSLTSINLSNFNTSNVTTMRLMFRGCSGLTSLDLSNFNTSNVTNMGGMFNQCTSLVNLDISNFDTSSVITLSDMFHYDSALVTLDLSSFNTSSATDMTSMFAECRGLTTIYVSNMWTTTNVVTGGDMFYNCLKITGQNGTRYGNVRDVTMAVIDTEQTPGYLTYRSH